MKFINLMAEKVSMSWFHMTSKIARLSVLFLAFCLCCADPESNDSKPPGHSPPQPKFRFGASGSGGGGGGGGGSMGHIQDLAFNLLNTLLSQQQSMLFQMGQLLSKVSSINCPGGPGGASGMGAGGADSGGGGENKGPG